MKDKKDAIQDSRLRSVLKGFTWRLVATLTTIVISYMVTGDIETGLVIGGVEFFAKIGLYYAHERAWTRIPLGTLRRLFKRKSS
jgi:uncharacterized membrane protein